MPESTSLSSLKPDKTPEGRYVFYLQEIKVLKTQKSKLIGEIKKLGKVFHDLNIAKKKVEKGIRDYSMGRFKELEGIGSDLMGELQVRKSILDKEDAEHTVQSVLLEEMSEYFIELAVILEAETVSNASKTASAIKDASSLAKRRENLNKMSTEVSDMHLKAKATVKDTDLKNEEAKKITTALKEELVEKREKISRSVMDLSNKEKELEGKEKNLKVEKKRLSDWETKLKDKEEALKRAKSELI